MYTGVGVGAAMADVAMSVVGVASPIPGTGQALKAAKIASAARAAKNAKTAMSRGRAAEKRVLDDIGRSKNTQKVTTSEGSAIPDALTSKLSTEIKDCATVACTKQIRIQTQVARESGRESELITGIRTHVSRGAEKAFDKVIRRNDLGPQ
jgi:hypothetical protein